MNGKKSKRLDVKVNAGSMADIAFLLLIFFLVTTTIEMDKGILVKLPPWGIHEPSPLPDKNVLAIKINGDNFLLVEGEPLNVEQLKDMTKEFIINPKREKNKPDKPTKAVVSLQNDRGTDYATYIEVYNELKAAYNELWNERANEDFNKAFDYLTRVQQKKIRAAIPMFISEAEPTDFEMK